MEIRRFIPMYAAVCFHTHLILRIEKNQILLDDGGVRCSLTLCVSVSASHSTIWPPALKTALQTGSLYSGQAQLGQL
jgi:hypothetical protein